MIKRKLKKTNTVVPVASEAMESLLGYSSSDDSDCVRDEFDGSIEIPSVNNAVSDRAIEKKPTLISAADLFRIDANTIHARRNIPEEIILTVAPKESG